MGLVLVTFGPVYPQSTFSAGVLPEINLIVPLSQKVKLRSSLESRESVVANNREDTWDYEHVLTDISVIASIKVGAGNALNAGYLVRFRNGNVFHRFMQQYRFVSDFGNFRLGHRLGIDQTFGGSDFVFRSRYRLTLETALNGARIDPKEFYLKLGNEYLWIPFEGTSELEIRLVPVLGFEIRPGHGIESGFDYRLLATTKDPKSVLWFTITYFKTLSLKN